jgi:hypothetical protein
MSTSAAFATILTADVFGMHFTVVTPQQRRKHRARLSQARVRLAYLSHDEDKWQRSTIARNPR